MSATFIAACSTNTPGINKATGMPWADATGAFLPEANRYRSHNGIQEKVHRVECVSGQRTRFDQLLRALVSLPVDDMGWPRRYTTFALFCHGWESGLQLGCNLDNVKVLARQMVAVGAQDPTIVLYACSAGGDNDGVADETKPGPGGDGGFADGLRDALIALGCRPTVFAHTVRGHATTNPYVRAFRPGTTKGGEWLVDPTSRLWPAWRRALQGELRFTFPHMSQENVFAALGG